MDCKILALSVPYISMIVVFLSDIGWYGLHQRPQHIALALAKQWRILWIQPATLGTKSVSLPELVSPNIYQLTVPAIPYNARSRTIRKLAGFFGSIGLFRKFVTMNQSRLLKRALKQIGEPQEKTGAVVHNFQLVDLLDTLHPSFMLFDYLDNVFGFTALPDHLTDSWKKAIRLADAITVTSPTLQKHIEQVRSDNIHLVGNGVEYDLFAKIPSSERPADLPLGKTIIGYVGAVYPWLDYELIRYSADAMPECEFVFIGPTHPDVAGVIKSLRQKPNIKFLGLKKYQQIPSYLRWFDAGIIPFQRNELTVAVNPVKLYEYSAAGVPTVVTDFSDDLHQFKGAIFIAQSKNDFVAGLRQAVEKRSNVSFRTSIQSFAREHDWDSKTSMIIQLIHNQLASGNKTAKEL